MQSRQFHLAALLALLVVGSAVPAAAITGLDMLRIDPTVRGSALGSHPVALGLGEISSLATNPAGLVGLEGDEASATISTLPLDLTGGNIAWGRPFAGGVGALGLSWLSYGSFDKRSEIGSEPTGSFHPLDLLVRSGWARSFGGGLAAGGGLKLLHSQIDDYSSIALAGDLGLWWATGFEGVDLGLTASNLGTQLTRYGETAESLPLTLRAGASKQLAHLPLRLGATAHYEALDERLHATGSGEFTVNELLRLRAGYSTRASDFRVEGDQDSFAGISAGIGLTHRTLRVDYTLHSMGALGFVHRIGVGARL